MPNESISVQLTPVMAKFIRTKVSSGEYPSQSALIRDAVERMQAAEQAPQPSLTKRQQNRIGVRVEQGIQDLEEGRYDECDAEGLRNFARGLVDTAALKTSRTRNRTKG